jgi:luciferase family oxidoreductase group 1
MSVSPFTLSVLDQSPIPEGESGAEALRNTIDLARLAERLGYRRYWVAEHHATAALACAAPEVIIGPIAAVTRHIRVGSGGIMLPHYSPLKVAESFSILAGLFPDRIDLGIGRAPGTDPVTSMALQRDRRQQSPDDFTQQLPELLAYLDDRMPANHPFARLGALPGRPEAPDVWLLGSSLQSAVWAAELGLPYMFADFINRQGAEAAAIYRQRFAASAHLAAPRVAVAIGAICAETDAAAERLSSSIRMISILLRTGNLPPVPTVEHAEAFLEEHALEARALRQSRRSVVGAPATVRAGLQAVAAEYGADEVMVLTVCHDHQARRRSYELIAEAFALPERAAA